MIPAWIGVDLDGTLAHYDVWRGNEHIGEPIEEMVGKVKKLLDVGVKVKIFTARAQDPEAIPYIEKYLEKIGLPQLEITNVKDYGCHEIWDDRAKQVVPNTGVFIEDLIFKEDASCGCERSGDCLCEKEND